MLADLAALVVLLVAFRWVGPLPRPHWKADNITRHEWFILGCLVLASLLGWLALFINSGFKNVDMPEQKIQQVQGR